MTMTQSEPLARGVAGRDVDAVGEKRRARLLAKILEAAPKLHEHRDPVAVLSALEALLLSLLPECRFLVKTRSIAAAQVASTEFTLRSNLADCDLPARQALADQVAEAGVPSFEADLDLSPNFLACCVPIRVHDRSYGAIFVAVPDEHFNNSDELTGLIRLLSIQAGLALESTEEIRSRRQEMEIMATETGGSLADPDLSLPDAKRAFEHWLVSARLRSARGNIAAAARSLHMDRGQLSRLVKRHRIDAKAFKADQRS